MCVCVCVCVVSVIVKRPVLPPSVVDGRYRNPLYYYYYKVPGGYTADSGRRWASLTRPFSSPDDIRH